MATACIFDGSAHHAVRRMREAFGSTGFGGAGRRRVREQGPGVVCPRLRRLNMFAHRGADFHFAEGGVGRHHDAAAVDAGAFEEALQVRIGPVVVAHQRRRDARDLEQRMQRLVEGDVLAPQRSAKARVLGKAAGQLEGDAAQHHVARVAVGDRAVTGVFGTQGRTAVGIEDGDAGLDRRDFRLRRQHADAGAGETRQVAVVGIEEAQQVTPRVADAEVARGGGAGVARGAEGADLFRIPGGQRLRHLEAAVGRAVVDHDDLAFDTLREAGSDRRRQPGGVVVAGDDEADDFHGGYSALLSGTFDEA